MCPRSPRRRRRGVSVAADFIIRNRKLLEAAPFFAHQRAMGFMSRMRGTIMGKSKDAKRGAEASTAEQHGAATKIQSRFRGKKARKNMGIGQMREWPRRRPPPGLPCTLSNRLPSPFLIACHHPF